MSCCLLRSLAVLLLCVASVACIGQSTVPAVLLSDIHFDPFHNPRVFSQLRAAPIEHWPAILNAVPDLVEDAEGAAMLVECRGHGLDTPWPLLKLALSAAHDAQPHPVFVTLSGDLIAHDFACQFRHLARSATSQDLSDFAAKTSGFVMQQLWLAFPKVPIFVALGNNDSGCADYRETRGSAFMKSMREQMLAGAARTAASGLKSLNALNVSPEGDYSYTLPKPLKSGRIIVLQDIFDAADYRTCSGADDRSAEADQIDWLRAQLANARARREQVWIVGHIPPGIDASSSFYKYVLRPSEMCSAKTEPFLDDAALANTLLDFADVIRVAIFGHTHMDEIRLLHRNASEGSPATPAAAVAVKLVPSITPYFGNHPAFMVAEINPRTLILQDWQTFVSPDPSGSNPPWTLAYRFSTEYHLPDLSAASDQRLANEFVADRAGKSARATAYRHHFYAGDMGLYALGLDQIWPAYACAVRESGTDAFHQCLCPASHP